MIALKDFILRKLVVSLFVWAVCVLKLSGQEFVNERAKWFVHDRFGMFIHWGVYSAAEGIWKGEPLRHGNNYAEWIRYRNGINKKEYVSLLEKFDRDKIDVEKWVLLAKKSGMRYIVITAKHHDGFCLWDTKVSDYNIANYLKRDIIKELAEMCKKHGMRLGFYYSHWIDWEHPYGWDHSKELTGIGNKEYNRYWQEKVIPQVTELLTDYGEIAIMWFDMWIHHSQTCVTKEQLLQLKNLIRELQPNCLVNSRLGLSVEEDSDVDFQTLGDNQLGREKRNFPWQSPATVAHSWGYHALDTDFKSTSFLLQALIGNVSLNGNYLLNIGPRANGDVPYEISSRLLDIGKWLKVNGESIYGAEAFDLRKYLYGLGSITYNKRLNRLYLHLFNWPIKGEVSLTGVVSKPKIIYMLADKAKTPLQFEHKGAWLKIHLPQEQTDPFASVVVMEYTRKPEIIKGLVAKNAEGGYALIPRNAIHTSIPITVAARQRYGTIPEHVKVKHNMSFTWKIYVEKPSVKHVDISYSSPSDTSKSKIIITAAKQKLQDRIQDTGKTVGEPNANWVIDAFKSHRLGEIDFDKAGYYDVTLTFEMAAGENMNFQWIWIQ